MTTKKSISPLRQRMLDDMRMRQMKPGTQKAYRVSSAPRITAAWLMVTEAELSDIYDAATFLADVWEARGEFFGAAISQDTVELVVVLTSTAAGPTRSASKSCANFEPLATGAFFLESG